MSKVLEAVIRHRAAEKDRFGDPLPDPSADVTYYGCRVGPLDTREGADHANTVITGLVVLVPHPADIRATDELTVRGKKRSVIGEPFDTGRKGLLVTVRGATG